ncbi:hypothetical protein [Nostoc favosum]|uniref:Uncharacterized protein n=1 Tax=Nostoc favosum CHAB5714 TaxID=2780399 RepID=A0ABS8I1E9_9NOSO|nr:hypothetical protein [Nostoc favosum]MCC5597960.1 hypothetical protein [Nostoc favosum CHAB5714]
MNRTNAQRRPQEGVQETWLVRREEAANERNAHSYSSQSPGCDITSSKHEQVGSHRNNDQRENATISFVGGGKDPGKISERLKLIEQSFLFYIHSHRDRLEAELDENRTLEERFLASIKELEREINSLVPEQDNLDEHAVDSNEHS